MPHLLGYARVSTADQNPDLQHDALNAAGCFRIFVDTASGALDDRPALGTVLDQLRPGDTLVVWKLDRSSSVARLVSVACRRTSIRPRRAAS
jgi:DNA invertase Pin-like site-specific DNA recombinase